MGNNNNNNKIFFNTRLIFFLFASSFFFSKIHTILDAHDDLGIFYGCVRELKTKKSDISSNKTTIPLYFFIFFFILQSVSEFCFPKKKKKIQNLKSQQKPKIQNMFHQKTKK